MAAASAASGSASDGLVSLALQVPVIFVAASMLETLGRRKTLLVLLGLLGTACAAMAILNTPGRARHHAHAARLDAALATLGCVVSNGMFSAMYVFSAEVFPTAVRPVGLATMSQAARLGAFCAPLILLLSDASPRLPFAFWAAVSLTASLAALLLPETHGKASLETLDDLSGLVALPSPVQSLGSSCRAHFRDERPEGMMRPVPRSPSHG